jgi:hypothetical protein
MGHPRGLLVSRGLGDSGFAAAGDGVSGFFVGGAAALGFSLIPELLAFGYCYFDLNAAILEVHPRGDYGKALLLDGGMQLENLGAVDQELAGAERVVIELRAGSVGSDVCVEEKKFSVLDQAIGILKVGLTGADGLDLGSAEGNSGFITVEQEEIMGGGAVDAGVPLATGDRVSLDVCGLVGLR